MSYPSCPQCLFYGNHYFPYAQPARQYSNQMHSYNSEQCISKTEVNFKSLHRIIWLEHVNWTRLTIISIVNSLQDIEFVQDRLLRNAIHMGNFIRPYYGDRIANQYTALIKEHLVLAAELVTAAVKGDSKTAEEKEKAWYKNADEIASFWNSINPYLSKEEIKKMFNTHLALTKQEAVSIIQKNYKESIEVFDKIEFQAIEMADMISDAIIRQFQHCF